MKSLKVDEQLDSIVTGHYLSLSVSSLWFSGVCAHGGCVCVCVLWKTVVSDRDGIKREEEEIFNWATNVLLFIPDKAHENC